MKNAPPPHTGFYVMILVCVHVIAYNGTAQIVITRPSNMLKREKPVKVHVIHIHP
ncbi:MAG: hypothetical protein OXP12_05385 [Thaumarchaeota archaeon]|nr:hypothetical protein [Nitrososphaerota archaeon]